MNEKILLAYFAAHATREDMMAHQECDVEVGELVGLNTNMYPGPFYLFNHPEVKIKRVRWTEYVNNKDMYRLVRGAGEIYSNEELKMKYALSMIWKLREFEKLLDTKAEKSIVDG